MRYLWMVNIDGTKIQSELKAQGVEYLMVESEQQRFTRVFAKKIAKRLGYANTIFYAQKFEFEENTLQSGVQRISLINPKTRTRVMDLPRNSLFIITI